MDNANEMSDFWYNEYKRQCNKSDKFCQMIGAMEAFITRVDVEKGEYFNKMFNDIVTQKEDV